MNNNKIVIGMMSAVVLFSGYSMAGTTSITTKYEQTFRENKDYKPKFSVGHSFDNNMWLGIEHQRRWKDEISGSPEFAETKLAIAYNYTLDDAGRVKLQPKLEWKFNSGKETMRPMLKLTYKLTDDWSIGTRYRYEYQSYSESGGKRSRVNRFDGYLSYAVNDSISLSWNPNYAYVLADSGTMYTGNDDRWEHEFKVGYKYDASNSFAVTYKHKDKIRDTAAYNAGEHNDAVQLAYTYKF